MSLQGRIGKLENKATTSGAPKGTIADWALEYVRENKARLYEGRTGEIMRQLVPAPDRDEGEITRQARYLTETYPNLNACRRGEIQRAERVHALLTPRFEEAVQ